MIVTCRHCHRAFWRYRRDWPPPFSCSFACWLARGTKTTATEPPLLPEDVIATMKYHRGHDHGTTSLLVHIDCLYCEALEQEYAASLQYHLHERMAREIQEEALRLKRHAETTHAS